ncbi:M1 family metallopeptidase [Coralloluteibacterium stylophorae]|uniref:Aminopeptidase N n=1 Tax=Coralloluteibacterium stylophorae TaxID=1776034 RepID=A0A8J7VRI4_9GAMM|nr:M1 family metallopeptidase [Coralloluteibacterium stylophorae]MBS7458801.1 M1 family metallopeptidase [Coralloluteibacterium stylophorae]
MRNLFLLLALILPAVPAFAQESAEPSPAQPDRRADESSYAEPERVVVRHLALDLEVDFDAKRLAGTADLTLEWLDPEADTLVLDTRDLDIERIEGRSGDARWRKLKYTLAERDPVHGQKLTVATPARPEHVRIRYRTAPEASGLQWLEPSMTQGGKLPFMFSQSQAIHARSWVPLQDTPSVRFTYEATVRTDPALMALMSADNDPEAERDGEYAFRMPQPIPSYLLAIAAGDLVFEPISARAGVWAEPAMAKKAAAEFADTGKMIEVAESLYGPYRWGRYDILVLPPSFPFGGMENPRLTFATPTVIVGDKSLVSLIAHELAHSWSGNLVTNATWKDIWLNEGFTSYVENRIVEAVYGREQAEMEFVIARNGLIAELDDIAPQRQALAPPPLGEGEDADGALSSIAYDKGAWFLQFLEQRFGRETFDAFLRGWFDAHAFQSVTTDQFRSYLQEHLLEPNPDTVSIEQVDRWLYAQGIPPAAPKIVSERLQRVDAARQDWLEGRKSLSELDTDGWITQEWVHFLAGMPETLAPQQMNELDAAFRFTGTANGEIAQRWYPLAVRSGYFEARPAISQFLKRIGRRKLIMPTYEALVATPDGHRFAEQVFISSRPGYHPITTMSVEALLERSRGDAE